MTKQVIWHHAIPRRTRDFNLPMGPEATTLGVFNVAGEWRIYVSEDPDALQGLRGFTIVDTGVEWDADKWRYVGTIIFECPEDRPPFIPAALVHHVLEEI